MKRFLGLIAAAGISLLVAGSLQAQNRTFGAQSFIMDDGMSHFFTMSAPAGMTGPVTFQFPLPPAGATPGFVRVGTSAGQTLYWNGINLDWEPSSIITNNTNGNGTNVTITAPLIGAGATFTTVSATTFTGALTGHASLDLALTGGTLSGALNMGTHQINAVTDPTLAQDAATKNYVDNTTNAAVSGTVNAIPKFTAVHVLGNSALSDNAGTLSYTGNTILQPTVNQPLTIATANNPNGQSGALNLTTGAVGGGAGSGVSGDVNITTGNNGTAAAPGTINITGGASTSFGVPEHGGNVVIAGGASGDAVGGNVTLLGGNGIGNSAPGGSITLSSGLGFGGGANGTITLATLNTNIAINPGAANFVTTNGTFQGPFAGNGAALTNLTGGNITAGTITNTQINATAGIVASKLNDGGATAGQVLTAVGGGAPTWQASTSITPTYFNAYTTFVPFTIAVGGTVPTTTVAANAGFIPDLAGGFIAVTAGTYKVDYAVAHNEPGAFAITVNGVVAPNSQFGCATGTTIINGDAILTLAAGDLVRLINSPNSATAMTLSPVVLNTVVASLTAVRLQ
jgi:hypothetical protein